MESAHFQDNNTGGARGDCAYPARRLGNGAPTRRHTAWPSLLGALLLGAAPPALAGTYEFDQRRTEVRFIYTMALATQHGRFTKVTGTLDYDQAAPEKSKVTAAIAAASLSTGEAIVDSELKGASFFNVDASPVIAFKSLAVKPSSPTAAELAGEITINGITKRVTLAVTLEPHDDPALKYDAGAHKFVAKTRIKRSAFKMTKYQALVDDAIDLEIDAIVRPKKGKTAKTPQPGATRTVSITPH